MAHRITLRDIAKRTGYHFTTVSMALRGDLSIPEATRDTIRRAANQMGYEPNPMAQGLATYRQARKPPAEHAPLAWLSNAGRSEQRSDYPFAVYLDSARTRARQFGYRLEEFLLGAKDMTPGRMQKILLARGITGILVPPQPYGRRKGEIRMDWSPFAAVTFGHSLAWPPLHMVTNHHGNAARLAVRKLADLGYRRIGLYVSKGGNARTGGAWLGGYAGEVLGDPRLAWIKPFLFEGKASVLSEFTGWCRRNRLDAAITYTAPVDEVLRSGAIRVPEKLGMASLRVSLSLIHI